MIKKSICFVSIFFSLAIVFGCSGGKLEIHHVFPQQLRGEFLKSGIDVDDFGIRLAMKDHRGLGGLHSQQWNKQWINFFKSNSNPSKSKIMNKLDDMLVETGFVGRLSFVKYGGAKQGVKTGEIIVKHSSKILRFAAFIGENLTKLLGGTNIGSMILSFFAALGSSVLGLFSIKTEHPVAVGIGFILFILGIAALIGIGYLAYLLYKWIMITIAGTAGTVAVAGTAIVGAN